ncbi:Ig-like domain-containing protein, partial [Klebsiella pneumoniae]|uniref:Ig-like domain-containing protein n=1 Tax=Klebsiella pneumoniae TaxID=573 RepID=UPI0030133555
TINVTANLPPSVTITNPTANAILTAPATFEFSVDASDPDDGLSDVEFYVGTNLVDDVFSAPFATGITNLTAGTYVLTAIAYDNVGATAT